MKKNKESEQRIREHKPRITQHPKTYTIRHDPDHVASVIKRHFDRRELHSIVRLLSADLPPQSHARVDIVEGNTISRLYEGLRWSELRVSACSPVDDPSHQEWRLEASYGGISGRDS
jgi:hypothetical protein